MNKIVSLLLLSISFSGIVTQAQSLPSASFKFSPIDSKVWGQELQKLGSAKTQVIQGQEMVISGFQSMDKAYKIGCKNFLADGEGLCKVTLRPEKSQVGITEFNGNTITFTGSKDVKVMNQILKDGEVYKTVQPGLSAQCLSESICQITVTKQLK